MIALTALWGAVTSPIGRKVVLAAAIVTGALVLRAHFVEVGRLKGTATATQQGVDQLVTIWKQDHELQVADRQRFEERIAQSDARAAAAESRAQQMGAALLAVAKQRTEAAAEVSHIADADLHAYTVAQLNLRAPGDKSACYTAAEERSLAGCVRDRPLVNDALAKATGKADELQASVAEQKNSVALEREKYASLAADSARLQGYFVTLYNLTAKKKRGSRCLWLWACSARTLPVPDPRALQTSAQSSGGTP